MGDFLQLVISGTATGAIYALAALAFTLLWQASGTVNFAQGDAPVAGIRAFGEKYEREYKSKSDHSGIKGYTGMYVVKAVTEKIGKFDRKAFAQAIKNGCFSTAQTPGLLMDLCFDDKGDIDRDSFLVELKGGKQVVVETLPLLKKK